jgi:SAM-dependent methyltransferase
LLLFNHTGTDIRQLILDEYPETSIVGVDLYRQFIDIGYDLFQDKNTLNVKFLTGNIFDDHFLSPSSDIVASATLDQYKHQVTYLNAGSVLHLFNGEQIRSFIQRAALLMKPGGWFVGAHLGGNRTAKYLRVSEGDIKHFESADDLKSVLEEAGFTKIDMRATERQDESRVNEDFVALWLTFKAVYTPNK